MDDKDRGMTEQCNLNGQEIVWHANQKQNAFQFFFAMGQVHHSTLIILTSNSTTAAIFRSRGTISSRFNTHLIGK